MPNQTIDPNCPRAQLRILATTDLHAHLLAWDYYSHRAAPGRGLAKVASLIAAARQECSASILVDNGDFLSGSGLGDYIAQNPPSGLAHPMIAAMNALGYDAVNLGNHEFSHGIAFLANALKDAAFPILCSNFKIDGLAGLQSCHLVTRRVVDDRGQAHSITIGIMGLLPAQTLVWEARHLHGKAQAQPMVECAGRMARHLRAQGADLVIALAHTGAAHRGEDLGEQSHAAAVAEIDGIDAVIAGHSHKAFPDGGPSEAGAAMILPGFFGSHLGVLDIHLSLENGKWRLVRHVKSLRPTAARGGPSGALQSLAQEDAALAALAQPMHSAIMTQAEQLVGHVPHRLHSYFATVTSSAAMAVIAQSAAEYLAQKLPETAAAGLPILAAVAPFKAGGHGGPDNFSDIAAGPFRHFNAAELYMHPNSITAFRLTGREVAIWLERSASIYHQILPNAQDAQLVNPDFPSFDCDSIFGVSYEIDLSQPPMFDSQGQSINPNTRRIRNLRFQGRPLDDTQYFALASNSYRRSANAGFIYASCDRVIFDGTDLVQDIVRDHVARAGLCPQPGPAHWRFADQNGATVVFETSPAARAVMAEVAHLRPEIIGQTDAGFMRFRFYL